LPGSTGGVGVEEQVAVFGQEQEQQPVDRAQELPVVVLRREQPCAERLPQFTVRRVSEEAPTEGDDGRLDPVS
jgi:hypothetical protein